MTENKQQIDTDALTRSAGRGMLWQVVGAGAQTIVQLGASAVLARVLYPEDFGMMGMALLAKTFVGRIGTLGTAAGVIAKKDVSREDLSTAFWLGVAVNGLMFVAAFVSAPLVSIFFRTPALTWVMRATSVTFLIAAMGGVHSVLLRKHLRFGLLKIIEVGGFVVQSGLAIVFAVVFDLNYWSLVWAMLISALATTVVSIYFARWWPSMTVSYSSFRFLFRYGTNGLGASIVGYFHHNIDYLLVGRLLGTHSLGFYEFAYRVPHMLLDKLAAPVGLVLFPTLAKIQSDDDRIAAGYIKTVKNIALIVFPMLGGLVAVAHPAVATLWGEKWLAIVVPLQILCFSSAIRCIMTPIGALFLCKNRPDIPFKYGLCTLIVTFGAVAGFGYAFGLNGVALGMLVSVSPSVVSVWLAFRLVHKSPLMLLKGLRVPAIAACVSSLGAYAVSSIVTHFCEVNAVILACAVATGALAYFSAIRICFPETLRETVQTMKVIIGRKR